MRRTRISHGFQPGTVDTLDEARERAGLECEGGAPATGHRDLHEWEGEMLRALELWLHAGRVGHDEGHEERLESTESTEPLWARLDGLARVMDWASMEQRRLSGAVREMASERSSQRGVNQALYKRAGLTPSEREVLELAEQGNSTMRIAELRRVSRHTVRTQLTKARLKMRVSRVGGPTGE